MGTKADDAAVDLEAVFERNDIDHLVREEAEAGAPGGFAHRTAEGRAKIEAVEAARGEDAKTPAEV